MWISEQPSAMIRKTAQKAYKRAKRNESEDWKKKVHEEEALYKSQSIKVLIVAHSYVLGDAYIGQPVIDYLKSMEVTPIRADVVDRKEALKQSVKVSRR